MNVFYYYASKASVQCDGKNTLVNLVWYLCAVVTFMAIFIPNGDNNLWIHFISYPTNNSARTHAIDIFLHCIFTRWT